MKFVHVLTLFGAVVVGVLVADAQHANAGANTRRKGLRVMNAKAKARIESIERMDVEAGEKAEARVEAEMKQVAERASPSENGTESTIPKPPAAPPTNDESDSDL